MLKFGTCLWTTTPLSLSLSLSLRSESEQKNTLGIDWLLVIWRAFADSIVVIARPPAEWHRQQQQWLGELRVKHSVLIAVEAVGQLWTLKGSFIDRMSLLHKLPLYGQTRPIVKAANIRILRIFTSIWKEKKRKGIKETLVKNRANYNCKKAAYILGTNCYAVKQR